MCSQPLGGDGMTLVRVALAVGLTLGVLVAPLDAAEQPARKVYRIGYIGNFPPTPSTAFLLSAFTNGLREYGYVEGRNLTIEFRWANGHEERYPELVRDLVHADVQLVVTAQTPAALALKEGAKILPVVLLGPSHPVEAGLVQSLARPGGTITGLSNQAGDLDAKILQLAREFVPKLSRLAVLWTPANQGSVLSLETVQALASKEGISVLPVSARSRDDLESVFSALTRERSDVLYVHGTYLSQAVPIGQLAIRNRLPTISVFTSMTRDGLLISYSPDFAGIFRRGAYYVDRIFKDTKPADLPVEQPTKFDLAINMRTTKALGLVMPPSLLLRADEVIE